MDAPFIHSFVEHVRKGVTEQERIYFNTLRAAGFTTIRSFSTKMELDNMEAHTIFEEVVGNANELIVQEGDLTGRSERKIVGKEKIVEKFLEDFVTDYEQRFFMAKVDAGEWDTTYKEFDIPLFILNKKRFRLAIAEDDFKNEEVKDDQLVHSIMKPIIPDNSYWWKLKLPY